MESEGDMSFKDSGLHKFWRGIRVRPGFLCGSDGMNLLAMQETQVQSLGGEDPLEK